MKDMTVSPGPLTIFIFGALYVISGMSQPLLMTACKEAGLTDPRAQLYMFFYYLGPAMLVLTLVHDHIKQKQRQASESDQTPAIPRHPSKRAVFLACAVSIIDIVSQTINYTGAAMTGASIFAVIYTSVTVWTALWSRLILGRSLNLMQWLGIFIVFAGVAVTALHSVVLGPDVKKGALLVVLGSAMRGAYYVCSEGLMNNIPPSHRLRVRQNAAIQGLTATTAFGIWQLAYTLPRRNELLVEPADSVGTTFSAAFMLLLAFSLASFIHSWALYFTLKHCPGGATSAGVMKGLQAVLVFGVTHALFCGQTGGEEMCFSLNKLVSLITVVTGVILFGVASTSVAGTYSQVTVAPDVTENTSPKKQCIDSSDKLEIV